MMVANNEEYKVFSYIDAYKCYISLHIITNFSYIPRFDIDYF